MGKAHGSLRLTAPILTFLALILAACSGPNSHAPTVSPGSPHPTPSATPLPTALTVIAPLGVNLRSSPGTSAAVLQVIAQGVTLSIVGHYSADGGWWQVKGATESGWVTAQPQYTSTQAFQTFSSAAPVAWSVMYPPGWTFAQQSAGTVVFTDRAGGTITFVVASTTPQLPAAAPTGATQTGAVGVEVFGVTAPLVTYASTTAYLASIEFQAQPALAFLIKAQLLPKTGAATLNLFLETVYFTPGAA
ncbi:MAG: SH3 domain-containing protein [Candidatus Dormiibacterota bacterium]